jgi:hypothetical protein
VTNFSNAFDRAGDSKNPLMDTSDDLANASFDPGLFAEISYIFSSFSDNDAGILGADEGTESQCFVS